MKKISLYLVPLIASALIITSCSKDEQNSPINDLTKSATLTGFVTAELDVTNSTPEYAPAGTKLIVTISASEFGETEGAITFTTLVEQNGLFSIELPTIDRGVEVTITPVDFLETQKQEGGVTKQYVFQASTLTASIKPGQKVYKLVAYDAAILKP